MVEVTQEVERAISKFIANAKIEGARLALEAAAKSARDYSAKAKLRCWATRPDSASVAGQHIAANIRAIDPAKIVGEG